MEAFAWNPACVPYGVATLAMLALGLYTALTRGDRLLRASLLAVLVAAVVYDLCMTLILCCNDPDVVAILGRIQVGPVSLLGPAMMLTILVINGRFEEHRGLLLIATLISACSCVFAWSTDLVIRGAWLNDWGLWSTRAGPLNNLHVSQFVGWALVGVWLARRGTNLVPTVKQRAQRRRIAVLIGVSLFGVTDTLLAHGYGVYPFSVVTTLIAIAVGSVGIFKYDILRTRGFDWAAAFELIVVVVLAAAVGVLLGFVDVGRAGASMWFTTVALVVMSAVAHFAFSLIHGGRTSEQVAAQQSLRPLEEFVEAATRTRNESELAKLVSEVLDSQLGFEGARLFVDSEGGDLVAVAEPSERLKLDRRVRAWVTANAAPLVLEELPTKRLGGLREPIETFIARVQAQIVLPVVDRGRLVGLIASQGPSGGRALRDDEDDVLRQVATASGNALTYLALFHEAEERVEVAREVEVASAVQSARAAGGKRLRFDKCSIETHYQPASQFGGDWWACHQLPDGRVLVTVGDVTGHGVPAALVSFTVEGACDTAQRMFGANMEVLALLQLLNQSVRNVGGVTYAMTCFAALFDFDAGKVTFSNAGHPFPYICRRDGEGTRLRSMVSRGTPLGTVDPILSVGTMDIEADDVFVFYSDALVQSRDPDGVEFGERRLQRVLRRDVRGAGAGGLATIIAAAEAHYHGHPIDDDITLVVVRAGT